MLSYRPYYGQHLTFADFSIWSALASSAGQFLYFGTHFGLSLPVYPELEVIPAFEEAISQKLYLVVTGYHSLFPIHL